MEGFMIFNFFSNRRVKSEKILIDNSKTRLKHIGNKNNVGVLLVNVGTPKTFFIRDIRSYLREFLSDNRVIEISRYFWIPILYCFILIFRPFKLSKLYKEIWTKEGSPMIVHSNRQIVKLREAMKNSGFNVEIELGMRYGDPSIKNAINSLVHNKNCSKILIIPLYPQYSSSTTGSAIRFATDYLTRFRNIPEFRFLKKFNISSFYIDSLVASINSFWRDNGQSKKLIVSFHGIPCSSVTLGDPYYSDCLETYLELKRKLGIDGNQIEMTFQSRFGYFRWLSPYTSDRLQSLAKEGLTRVDIICPGFIVDCLETLEEVDYIYRQLFIGAGGKEFNMIPSLNDNQLWINKLSDLVKLSLNGW
ncbi:ferrochelatase hemH [Candidatus Kinetoplastibacterium blastocrithidii TCC012E]|uniref:Ferrochelatase n=2 Tax=Candidatus Kinetoplastidibacterium blastocrithidiae TaxID=233181 RepID=M1M4C3_9PROT|nr:ferrochelatase [Candidatus Kinetoplastibacterium blastocrithidii]AFZ83829.1 ferrochelatase [Candidatus Kinetoplastibacterium blastocrithidii (ex Strigomonas culicis)]AGF49954.1 ferrochelatase hemH [Candidatus Kinetoplastibacterium blastocrithidii TCC012E]